SRKSRIVHLWGKQHNRSHYETIHLLRLCIECFIADLSLRDDECTFSGDIQKLVLRPVSSLR
ncbi:MAG: hypothetical protein L0I35_09780, partial [Hafniaceae bacterium]|nr:hypothetical protein [Hafniaceae bacterium]